MCGRVIGRGGHSRNFVGIRRGLNLIIKYFVELARQHRWSTQLLEIEPLLVFVAEEYIGDT